MLHSVEHALLMHAAALQSAGLKCDPFMQVVSAMEAIGVAELIGKFSADPGNPKVGSACPKFHCV